MYAAVHSDAFILSKSHERQHRWRNSFSCVLGQDLMGIAQLSPRRVKLYILGEYTYLIFCNTSCTTIPLMRCAKICQMHLLWSPWSAFTNGGIVLEDLLMHKIQALGQWMPRKRLHCLVRIVILLTVGFLSGWQRQWMTDVIK
jgi:hypothetical protein